MLHHNAPSELGTPAKAPMKSRPVGFTIIELMITLVLISILAAIAAPSVRDTIRNARMTSIANDLLTDMSIARAEAVKRGIATAVCASTNGTSCGGAWKDGWIIFTDSPSGGAYGTVNGDDAVLKRVNAIEGANDTPPNTIITEGGESWVGFRPSGMVRAGGDGAEIVFNLCDPRTTASVGEASAKERGRQIRVSGTGRTYIVRRTCP